jgi:putative transposase
MAKTKNHSTTEIAAKLAQADDMMSQGKLQTEIARTLGVSVMTLHRWRKGSPRRHNAAGPTNGGVNSANAVPDQSDRIAELQLENVRLRRLVTDLLLERMKLEEAADAQGRRRLS